ncbi:universal stress protein [Prosthecomicrobium sp. N25]|uniref:universal stress protein n=1 Tax=Prosthecomicrobium sp. N25 TaxID=3129254 RepID=UPI0030774B3A
MSTDLLLALSTYPDPTGEAVLPLAVAFARHLDADVTALALEVDIPDVENPLAVAVLKVRELIESTERRSHQSAEALLGRWARLAAEANVRHGLHRVRAAPARMGETAVHSARFHQMVALPVAPGDPAERGLAEILVFESGRPVVLLPEGRTVAGGFDRVVVATDFGRAATRALFDADPLLRRARMVHVVTASDEKDVGHGNRAALAAHLDRCGLRHEFGEVETGGRPVGEVLQDHAIALGAGLLVMGAYGHSRLRQFVLGGATATVLHDLRLPVLMSH